MGLMEADISRGPSAFSRRVASAQTTPKDLRAEGEPWTWILGGALALGVTMVAGLLLMVLVNGLTTFWPRPIEVVEIDDGTKVAGDAIRSQVFSPGPDVLEKLSPATRAAISANGGLAERTLFRVGNYDVYGDDYRWVADFQRRASVKPKEMILIERLEWGPFIGTIKSATSGGVAIGDIRPDSAALASAHKAARARWAEIRKIERGDIGAVNHTLEAERLRLRRVMIGNPTPSERASAEARFAETERRLTAQYETLSARAQQLRAENEKDRLVLEEIGGREVALPLSAVVRLLAPNELGFLGSLGVYFSRWIEFLLDEPREANTEGGIMPAIFGTFAMTLLLVIAVAPFGVITALYLREYASQGRIIAFVRISVNNLAGVPSIVYGVFGLGFFAYIVGGSIDQLFFPEKLPSPTFGTGGLLWSSLTLALLTVPVVIVATEEALAAVPRSMREGSLACGASKWQTIRNIVLPRAMPGIMTGLILAMARGAGEVAPLMLVGVVKLAPELPIDGYFPFIHLERSFMHLGFHIYDVGFQSRNSEAGKPMVFVTTLLLLLLIFLMNIGAIIVRNRLKRRFQGSQF